MLGTEWEAVHSSEYALRRAASLHLLFSIPNSIVIPLSCTFPLSITAFMPHIKIELMISLGPLDGSPR